MYSMQKNFPSKDEKGEPKLVPFSRTKLAEGGVSGDNNRQKRKTFECPHCGDYRNNTDPSKLRLHIFLHTIHQVNTINLLLKDI